MNGFFFKIDKNSSKAVTIILRTSDFLPKWQKGKTVFLFGDVTILFFSKLVRKHSKCYLIPGDKWLFSSC